MILCVTGKKLAIFDAQKDENIILPVTITRPNTVSASMKSLFLQVWGSYQGHYYDPFFHGQDMEGLKSKYLPRAAECRTRPEIYGLINDSIRELKSSHVRLIPGPVFNTVVTGSLGVDLGPGLKILSLVPGGPAENGGIKQGESIVAVGEKDLGPDDDLDRFLTSTSLERLPEVRLAIRDSSGDVRTVFLTPITRGALRLLKYEAQIARRKETVRDLGGNRLSYHHIRVMSSSEVKRFRKAIEVDFPEAEGLVLDERDGIGGMAHRPLCSLLDSGAADRLNRSPACWMRNRNGWNGPDTIPKRERASSSWDKPVILIQNEISRSDKEIFPHTFRHLGIGWIVGMPTAGGVIGGSYWKMEDGSHIVVSVQGWFTTDGRNMEGWGVPPDFRVPVTHGDLHSGRDPQLEKAIELLLAQMDGKISPPSKTIDPKKPDLGGK